MADVSPDCRTYTLSFQADDITQISIIKGWLRDSPLIESAMSPVGITYYFKSYEKLPDIRNAMSFLFPNGKFIICEISIAMVDGSMPADAWAWFMSSNNDNPNEIRPETRKIGTFSLADLYKMK